MERLREDPTIPELFGLESVVSDDTVRRFFASIDPVLGAEWIARQVQPLWRALPERIILDWDSTVLTKYGHQEGAEVGYNPTKPGRRSLHPLLAVVAGTRLCPVYRFRSGDTVSASQWLGAMEDAQRWLGEQKVWLNRGDLGFGQDAVMAWHEEQPERPHYLFKLKLSSRVRAALHAVQETAWQGPATTGAWQLAEGEVQLTGWNAAAPGGLRAEDARPCGVGKKRGVFGSDQARVCRLRDGPAHPVHLLADPAPVLRAG